MAASNDIIEFLNKEYNYLFHVMNYERTTIAY